MDFVSSPLALAYLCMYMHKEHHTSHEISNAIIWHIILSHLTVFLRNLPALTKNPKIAYKSNHLSNLPVLKSV